MYKAKDTVLYGAQGLCLITEIIEKTLDDQKVQYYVLHPVYDDKLTIYVPKNNTALTSKMRRILSVAEIHDLIRSIPDEELIWIENESLRRERYKEIIANGDRRELVQLIKTLYLHQQKQKENGKKMHLSDERFFKEAEKLLYEEFAHVLHIEVDQVLPLIFEQVQIEDKHRPVEEKN